MHAMIQALTTRRSASGSSRDARRARHSLPLGAPRNRRAATVPTATTSATTRAAGGKSVQKSSSS